MRKTNAWNEFDGDVQRRTRKGGKGEEKVTPPPRRCVLGRRFRGAEDVASQSGLKTVRDQKSKIEGREKR